MGMAESCGFRNFYENKVKAIPYTLVCMGVPVREDNYPEPSACAVEWPVPVLAAFISSVLPPGGYPFATG